MSAADVNKLKRTWNIQERLIEGFAIYLQYLLTNPFPISFSLLSLCLAVYLTHTHTPSSFQCLGTCMLSP